MKFLGQGFQSLEQEQDRQTDTETDATERIITPHSRVVKYAEIRTTVGDCGIGCHCRYYTRSSATALDSAR